MYDPTTRGTSLLGNIPHTITKSNSKTRTRDATSCHRLRVYAVAEYALTVFVHSRIVCPARDLRCRARPNAPAHGHATRRFINIHTRTDTPSSHHKRSRPDRTP